MILSSAWYYISLGVVAAQVSNIIFIVLSLVYNIVALYISTREANLYMTEFHISKMRTTTSCHDTKPANNSFDLHPHLNLLSFTKRARQKASQPFAIFYLVTAYTYDLRSGRQMLVRLKVRVSIRLVPGIVYKSLYTFPPVILLFI